MPSTAPPRAGMRRHGAVQALRAQPGQVAAGVLGAGQHDPVGARQQFGGLRAQRSRTPGTFFSGWNSSRLLMRG